MFPFHWLSEANLSGLAQTLSKSSSRRSSASGTRVITNRTANPATASQTRRSAGVRLATAVMAGALSCRP